MANPFERAKQAVRARFDGEQEEQRIDQLEARKERAQQQARREARREQAQQEIEQARQTAREDVQEADQPFDDSGGSFLERAAAAVGNAADQIDLDGDGTVLAEELQDDGGQGPAASGTGLASGPFGGESGEVFGGAGLSEPENDGTVFAQIDELEQGVTQNEREIDDIERELDALTEGRQDGGFDPEDEGFDGFGDGL